MKRTLYAKPYYSILKALRLKVKNRNSPKFPAYCNLRGEISTFRLGERLKFDPIVYFDKTECAFDTGYFEGIRQIAKAVVKPIAVSVFKKMLDKRFVLRNQNVIGEGFVPHPESDKFNRPVINFRRGRKYFEDDSRIGQNIFFFIVK